MIISSTIVPPIDDQTTEYIKDPLRAQRIAHGQRWLLELIARGARLHDVLDTLIGFIEEQAPGILGSILILDDTGQRLRRGAAPHLPPDFIKATDGILIGPRAGSCGTAAYRRSPVIVGDIATDPLWEGYRKLPLAFGLRACWSTPIMSSTGEVLGAFAMYYQEPHYPDPEEQELVQVGAYLASIAIERDRAERQRRQDHAARDRLATIVETSDDAITSLGIDGRILSWNAGAERLLGYTAHEAIGRPVVSFLAPKRQADGNALLESVKQAGVSQYTETWVQRKQGDAVRLSFNLSPIKDRTGVVTGIAIIARDVTSLRRTQKALQENEELFRRVFTDSGIAGALIGLDGKWQRVNRALTGMLGYTDGELIGQQACELVHPDDRAVANTDMTAIIVGQLQSCQHEQRYRHKDERWVWLHVDTAAVFNSVGKPTYLIVQFQDITERRRAEALAQGQQAMLELMAVGTPLKEVFHKLVEFIEGQTDGMLASVLLLDAGQTFLHQGFAPHLPPEYVQAVNGLTIGPNAASCGTAAYLGQTVIASDITTDPHWEAYRDLALHHSIRACWSTPIFSTQREVLGTFALQYREPRHPTPEDLELLGIASHIASIAIEKSRLEDQRRQTAALYRALVEGAPAAVLYHAELDGSGSVSYISPQIESILGFTPQEWMSNPALWEKQMHPDDRQRVQTVFQALAASHDAIGVEYRLFARDGRVVWVRDQAVVMEDKVGELPYCQGVLVDITASKQAEARVRESEAQLAEAQRIAHIGSWEYDLEAKTLVCSTEFYRICGVQPDYSSDVQARLLACIHPEDRSKVDEFIHTALSSPKPQEMYCRLLRPSGQLRILHVRCRAVMDKTDRPIKLVGTIQDDTHLKLAENALRVSEARFRSAFDNAAIGMALLALNGRFILVNRSLEQMLGYSQDEFVATDFQTLTHPDDLGVNLFYIQELVEGSRETFQYEKRYFHKRGHTVWVMLSVSLIRNNEGEPLYFVAQVQDITQRRRAEAELDHAVKAQRTANEDLQRLNQAKSDFVTMVSHEFRSALAGIRSFSEVMTDLDLSIHDMKKYAASINADADRLSRMITDLLDLDRIESGQLRLHLGFVDINEIIRDVANLYRHKTTHTVRLQYDINVPTFAGDVDKLTQTLINLVENAIKYSPEGGDIIIKSQLQKEMVHVSVQDFGIGIPHSALETVFERYIRVESDATRYIMGTGLGLPIAQRFIMLHGGRIWAESIEGKGSTFHFTLPLNIFDKSQHDDNGPLV